MIKVSTDKELWRGQVSTYQKDMSAIKSVPNLTLSETTLVPFVSFKNCIASFNESVKGFQSYINAQTENMNKVSENKVQDDQAGAERFRKGPSGM